jgi:hypothetical protein
MDTYRESVTGVHGYTIEIIPPIFPKLRLKPHIDKTYTHSI